jgi:hypothetical protein
MLVILSKPRAAEYASLTKEFEGVPGCRVILDQRVAERRRGQDPPRFVERRLGERRAGRLQDSDGLAVVFLC